METKLNVTLITHTPNPEIVVAGAAKLCYSPSGIEDLYDSLSPETTEKFIKQLMSVGHESPIEHVSFTFGIEGVSRTLSHQLVRHRIASFSQKSQRYVTEGQFEYVVPDAIKKHGLEGFYAGAMEQAQENYDSLINELMYCYMEEFLDKEQYDELKNRERQADFEYVDELRYFKEKHRKKYNELEKRAAEDARYVLPNAVETKLVVTMNARTLYNFFELRCCRRAQGEINELAWAMREKVMEKAPSIFKSSGPSCLHGKCREGKMTCGKPYRKEDL